MAVVNNEAATLIDDTEPQLRLGYDAAETVYVDQRVESDGKQKWLDAAGNVMMSITTAGLLTAATFSGAHSGDGSALTALNASNLGSGNVPAARMPTGGTWGLTSDLTIQDDAATPNPLLVIDEAQRRVAVARASAAETLDVGGNARIRGDLIVDGDTVTLNTETIQVDDNIIVLNSNVTGTPSEDAGVEIERGTSTNARVLWDEDTDTWTAGFAGSEVPIVLADGSIAMTGALDLGGNAITNVSTLTTSSDVTVSTGVIIADQNVNPMSLRANGNMQFAIDVNNDETGNFFAWFNDGLTTELMRLEEPGTLSLGTTDIHSWGSSFRAIQVAGAGALFSSTTAGSGDVGLVKNAYRTNSDFKYMEAAAAQMIAFEGGDILLRVATSGTADAIISWTTGLKVTNNANVAIESGKKLYLDGGGDTYISEYTTDRIGLEAGGTRVFDLRADLIYGTQRSLWAAPSTAINDSTLGNSELSWWVDETNNALTFRVKYSDGTLKTGEVTLA